MPISDEDWKRGHWAGGTFVIPPKSRSRTQRRPRAVRKASRHQKPGRTPFAYIPEPWLRRIAKLPGKAVLLANLIRLEAGRKADSSAILSTKLLTKSGIDRKQEYRALRDLETAGVIRVERKRGARPVVIIVEQDEETDAGNVARRPSGDSVGS